MLPISQQHEVLAMVSGSPDRQRIVAELRERIRWIEGRGGRDGIRSAVLTNWMPAGCRIAGGELHEVLAGGDTDAAATAFTAALAGRLRALADGDVGMPKSRDFR